MDQESEELARTGHEVRRFEKDSDEIEHWSAAQKALLPARVVWSRESHRELAALLRGYRPDVVHVHNTFPLVSASVLYACRDASVPVVTTIHNYRLVCAPGDFMRQGTVCHDCVNRLPLRGRARLLPGFAGGHRAAGRGQRRAPQGVAVAGLGLRVHLGGPARPAPRPSTSRTSRVFVRHNMIPYRDIAAGAARAAWWPTSAGLRRPRACGC